MKGFFSLYSDSNPKGWPGFELYHRQSKELSAINPNLLSDGKTLVSRASKIIIKDLALDVKIVK